nr:hypothetical protein [uncultured Blautia sp.]
MEKKENERKRVVLDGTAFYEIDLECVERKRKEQKERERERQRQRKGAH